MEADLSELEASLRYTFKDKELLRLALTHSSVSRCANAERLEFLGDAVLDFVTVDHMFRTNVHFEPMDLHDTKSKNTCNRNLASKAYKLGLHKFLHHKSEHLQAQLDLYCADHAALRPSSVPAPAEMGTAPISAPLSSSLLAGVAIKEGKVVGDVDSTSDVLADTLEAIIGAIFLDCGEDTAVIQRFAAENDLLIA
jgi:dsRNA-specific ribonuclease